MVHGHCSAFHHCLVHNYGYFAHHFSDQMTLAHFEPYFQDLGVPHFAYCWRPHTYLWFLSQPHLKPISPESSCHEALWLDWPDQERHETSLQSQLHSPPICFSLEGLWLLCYHQNQLRSHHHLFHNISQLLSFCLGVFCQWTLPAHAFWPPWTWQPHRQPLRGCQAPWCTLHGIWLYHQLGPQGPFSVGPLVWWCCPF